jgi:hypothetical protein
MFGSIEEEEEKNKKKIKKGRKKRGKMKEMENSVYREEYMHFPCAMMGEVNPK